MTQALKTRDIRPHNTAPSNTWSSAGAAYDEVSRGILDAIEHAINRLEPKQGETILDLATGTGWGARRLAERGFKVIASDFAPDVLAAGQQIATARNLDITFEQGDAEDLTYPDNAFDAILSTFGVMFVQRPEDAASEIARICKPGGRMVLATWTPDSNVFEMFRIMKAYMPTPDSPPPSPFDWGKPERIKELFADNFDLSFEQTTSYYREPNGEAAWDTFSVGYGPLRTLAGKLDDQKRDQLKADWIAFHEGFATELGITVPRNYWVIKGVRK